MTKHVHLPPAAPPLQGFAADPNTGIAILKASLPFGFVSGHPEWTPLDLPYATPFGPTGRLVLNQALTLVAFIGQSVAPPQGGRLAPQQIAEAPVNFVAYGGAQSLLAGESLAPARFCAFLALQGAALHGVLVRVLACLKANPALLSPPSFR